MQLIQTNSVLKLANYVAQENNVEGLKDVILALSEGERVIHIRELESRRLVEAIEQSGIAIADQIYYQALPVKVKKESAEQVGGIKPAGGFKPESNPTNVMGRPQRVFDLNGVSGDSTLLSWHQSEDPFIIPTAFNPAEDFDPSQMVIVSLQLKSHFGFGRKRGPMGWSNEQASHDFVRYVFDRNFYILEHVNPEYCNLFLIMTFDDVQQLVRICNDQENLISHVINKSN